MPGIDIDDVPGVSGSFQCLVEGACAGAPRVPGYIDGGFHSPVIGCPSLLNWGCIGVSYDASIPDCCQIWIPFQGGCDAVLNSWTVGTLIFKK